MWDLKFENVKKAKQNERSYYFLVPTISHTVNLCQMSSVKVDPKQFCLKIQFFILAVIVLQTRF